MENPLLSVVILNWNTCDLLEHCLASVLAATREISSEILVVDNGSSDNSVDMLQNRFRCVHLIALSANVGFARGNNIGLRESKGQYRVLLNPDTLVAEDALRIMVEHLETHPDVGAVGPHLVYPDGSTQLECARAVPTILDVFYRFMSLGKLVPRVRLPGSSYYRSTYDRTRSVGVISGSCMMVRRDVIEQVGPLDESFFLGGEDIEWCVRIRNRGWRIHYISTANVVHYQEQSKNKAPIESKLYAITSDEILIRLLYGNGQASLYRAMVLILLVPKLLVKAFWQSCSSRSSAEETFRAVLRLVSHYVGC
jgi:hypothetical protein